MQTSNNTIGHPSRFMHAYTHTSRKGFTLIELLVVIAIIGLLASVVLASLNSAREKGRDARRVADMKQLQLALELYYDKEGAYPNEGVTSWASSCSGSWSDLQVLVDEGFLPSLPVDPTNGGTPFCYLYRTGYLSAGFCEGGATNAGYVMLFGYDAPPSNPPYPRYTSSESHHRYCVIGG